jgi:hypothetical protein
MSNEVQTRRRFLALVPALCAGLAASARPAWAAVEWARPARRSGPGKHPDPRPGIDGSHVLTRAQLTEHPEAAPVFDMVREIPQVADGIRCNCGCAEDPDLRSLLSCFEGEGMARHCQLCQQQARLVHDLHKRGRTLGVIRSIVDRRF